mmetsp:Transcript_32821/g.87058  ORF Transcript_32821/g.87058 Transcript_32821/m.87058 type:complete len:526 (-) Transcript_32821:912-2489(-)
MKVSSALVQKVVSNQSGSDLKITGLIPFDSLSQLCEALAVNESTDRLDLEGCGVGDMGCVLIRDLLVRNTKIKHVDLQMNQISDVGCKALAESLNRNSTLEKLYLGYNDIRDDGVIALANAIRPRGNLEVVVSGNSLVSDDALLELELAMDPDTAPLSPLRSSIRPTAEAPPRRTRADHCKRHRDDDGRSVDHSSDCSSIDGDVHEPDPPFACGTQLPAKKPRGQPETPSFSTPAGSGAAPRCPTTPRPAKQPSQSPPSTVDRSRGSSEDTVAMSSVLRGKDFREAKGLGGARRVAKEVETVDIDRDSSDCDESDDSAPMEPYQGAPFSFNMQDSASSGGCGGEESRTTERKELDNRFALQWNRFRVMISDQLSREIRLLSLVPGPESLFETTCRALSRRDLSRYPYGVGGANGERPGEGASAGGCNGTTGRLDPSTTQNEKDRRRAVEARVRLLMLKFRHVHEDILREQRCMAQAMATAHGVRPFQGALPAGVSPEMPYVPMPCPFRLEVRVYGSAGESRHTLF